MARPDPHSYRDDLQPSTQHMRLSLTVNPEQRALLGEVTLELNRAAEGQLDLDTRGLEIQRITDAQGAEQTFELGAVEGFMGARLRVNTHSDKVTVHYQTSPDATALQWLAPEQTQGGKHPYVFTQCQAIHARSIVPCQDSPAVRATFDATLNIPKALKAVMAAASLERTEDPGKTGGADRAVQTFRMPQPIPSYLLAFAVGNIEEKELGPRSKIYAEPELLEQAAWEFAEVDDVLRSAEALFGEYPWDRFDLLVMPPSFPYGGMENPRLTFLTPTLIAKDRSLVNVVAHELAHSWTGNLVTNANMNHFWLNEGFTVYAERRILEKIEGEASKALHAALGLKGLQEDIDRLQKVDPQLTRLRNDLSGIDPDEVYSLVPYEKGYMFLVRLESLIGRARFDAFLGAYIERFKFRSIVTDDFLAFFKEQLPEAAEQIGLETWIEGSGIPDDAPTAVSERLTRVEQLAEAWGKGERPEALDDLDPTQWQLFLSMLPKKQPQEACAWLQDRYALSEQNNHEIKVNWLSIAAASGYAPAYPHIEATLRAVGRMKYLRPLYGALLSEGETGQALAKKTFEAAQHGYHPVARAMVASMLP